MGTLQVLIQLLEQLPIEAKQHLDSLLEKAITISGANKGTLQIYDRKNDNLVILTQKGFGLAFLNHFKNVKPFDGSACGRAAGTGIIVSIEDVTQDPAFNPHTNTALLDGVKAVQSIPLFSGGLLVGVMSVHFCEPKVKLQRNAFVMPVADKVAESLSRLIDKKESIHA